MSGISQYGPTDFTNIELPPLHHKTDERIRAHVILCMLGNYVQWHFMKRLAPLFEEQARQFEEITIQAKDRDLTLPKVLESPVRRCGRGSDESGIRIHLGFSRRGT